MFQTVKNMLPGNNTPQTNSSTDEKEQIGNFDPQNTGSQTPVQIGESEGGSSLLSQSVLLELESKPVNLLGRSVETKANSSEPQELQQDILVTLKKLSAAILQDFNYVKSQSVVNDETALDLIKREKELTEEIRKFKEVEEKVVSESLEDLKSSKKKRTEPHLNVLVAISERFTVLVNAYKATENGSAEAKSHFAHVCRCEMNSALLNEGVIGEKFAQLKADVSKNLFATESVKNALDKKADTFIDLLKAGIQEVKDPSIAPEAETKLAKLYSILSSVKIPTAVIALYVAGQLESTILELVAPETLYTLLESIKAYLGAPTVPVLCFALSMFLCFAYKFAVQTKEKYRPVAEDIKLAQEKTVLLNMIAAKA